MMLVVFGFAVLVLAIGMAVLFAMFGELSARVAETGASEQTPSIQPLERARIGHAPESWPPSIARPGQEAFTLIVLSSVCSSCGGIAAQLTSEPGHRDWAGLGVVISTGRKETGENFVASYGLGGFPHYIDELGDWTRSEFDVQLSPSALVFRGGVLTEAYSFNDVAMLRAAVNQQPARAS